MLQTVASPIRQPENANGEEELIFFSAEELTLSDIEMLQAEASPKRVNGENEDGEDDAANWGLTVIEEVASPIRQPENANDEEELIFFSAEELTLSDIEMLQAVASPKTVNDENKDGEDDATNWELTVIEEGDIDFHIEDRSPSHISIISSCDDDDDDDADGDDDVFTESYACVRCGADLGEFNPRQLCRKSYCEITDY
jgi:hypothetical protein